MTRRKELFGTAIRYGDELKCGYDRGVDGGPICAEPATLHAWAGSVPDTRLDAAVYSCDQHFTILEGKLWDWHPVGGACGIPGALWHSGSTQGIGLCRHEFDGQTMTADMAVPELSDVSTD